MNRWSVLLALTAFAAATPSTFAQDDGYGLSDEAPPAHDENGEIADDEAPVVEVADEDDDEGRNHWFAMGAGLNNYFMLVNFPDGLSRYNIVGPSVTADWMVSRRNLGFGMRFSTAFPTTGREQGESPDAGFAGSLRTVYEAKRWALDGTMGISWIDEALGEDVSLLAHGGLHLQALQLNGSEFSVVETIAAGVGGHARISWAVHEHVDLGAMGSLSADFLGLIDQRNGPKLILNSHLSFMIGFRN